MVRSLKLTVIIRRESCQKEIANQIPFLTLMNKMSIAKQ